MADAQDRGWGPGWPNCDEGNWEWLTPQGLADVSFGRTHKRIRELSERLIQESRIRGYVFHDGQCWGAVCRAVRGSTTTPSNHSWGLALDFNSARNPLGSDPDASDIPDWMVQLWGDFGFFWGGRFQSRPDPMHFEFAGTPEQADKLTADARQQNLGEDRMTDQEKQAFERLKEDVQYLRAINNGMEKRLQGKPEPEEQGPQRAGWRRANRFLEEPKA